MIYFISIKAIILITLEEGETAINFELIANDDSKIILESFKGKKNVVLCFYPKNHLFACPSKKVFKIAKSVVSAYPDITSTDSVLFAVSIDSVDDQKKFVKEYDIPYLHLSDSKKDVCKNYTGLNIAGLAKRSTFVIDKKGIVRKIFRKIDADNHGNEIADFLKQLN